MKRVLMIIAQRDFQDLEFGNPYRCFQQQGYHVDIASGSGGACRGAFGLYVKNSLSFEQVVLDSYDALVFVGGGGAYEEYWENPRYQALACDFLVSP